MNQQQPKREQQPSHYIKKTMQPDGTMKRTRTRDRGAKQRHKQPDCEREPAGVAV